MFEGKKIIFIGGGNMGEAMLRRMLSSAVITVSQVAVAEKTQQRQHYLETTYGIAITSLETVADSADYIFLAIKPQQLTELPVFTAKPGAIVISILAGTPIAKIKGHFNGAHIVRTMPNLGYTVGSSVTGVFFDSAMEWGDDQKGSVHQLLNTGGLVIDVAEETTLNEITAVSGSGPAYFFWFAEQIAAAAEQFGFAQNEANSIARDVLIGAAKILEANPSVSLSEFRERVTSKGGTTEAALGVFASSDARQVVYKALEAARDRSRELSI